MYLMLLELSLLTGFGLARRFTSKSWFAQHTSHRTITCQTGARLSKDLFNLPGMRFDEDIFLTTAERLSAQSAWHTDWGVNTTEEYVSLQGSFR